MMQSPASEAVPLCNDSQSSCTDASHPAGTEEAGWIDDDGWDPFSDGELSWLNANPWEDEIYDDSADGKQLDQVSLRPSEFVHMAFRMPKSSGVGYERFSFKGRRHMVQIYNSKARRLLLKCARQSEKSTLVGNLAITYCCLIPAYKFLYVSPSALQTKTFSNDRIKEPIETSGILKSYTSTLLSRNVFEKQFINRSKITLRYAFLTPDRVRGIPAWALGIDEIQDIVGDSIPVMEHCTSHAHPEFRRFVYSGTPKSLDNTIEWMFSNRSTQGEWVVPCDCIGGDKGRFWNILGERNIGKKHLICARCGKQIFPDHENAQWAFMQDWDEVQVPFESYRISQLMVPWKPWPEILYDYENSSRAKFFNEALGLSYDSGFRPITQLEVRACCDSSVSMEDDKWVKLSRSQPIFAGLDHGTGENSYSVLTLSTYVGLAYQVFFMERFVGEYLDLELQMDRIYHLLDKYSVRLIGSDYGGGFDRNDKLVRRYGTNKVVQFQYVPKSKKKVYWQRDLRRFMVSRTAVMSDLFSAMKRKNVIRLPRWEETHAGGNNPYCTDITNIFSEYSEALHMIQYKHTPGKPDDTFHSILYGFLASMLITPRPDIIKPAKETGDKKGFGGSYTGTLYQG